jgi:hypothetical protein
MGKYAGPANPKVESWLGYPPKCSRTQFWSVYCYRNPAGNHCIEVMRNYQSAACERIGTTIHHCSKAVWIAAGSWQRDLR